jgi:tRNA threonylcarbamoyladenosine biosynthesis protein TsaB
MRVLAIETVETSGSVAALVGQQLLCEIRLPAGQRSAQSLAPAISRLLGEVGWRPGDVELVAVASGPGSFTGLRIGVTTAKAFAFAAGCPVIGVHTLEAIAAQAPAEVAALEVVLDAQRGELFAASLQRTATGTWTGAEQTRVATRQNWAQGLAPSAVVSGPPLAALQAALPAGTAVLPAELWMPQASAVGRLGAARFAAGERSDVFALVPRYFRRTAAEEQWERRQRNAST